jgi:hypothetical protein
MKVSPPILVRIEWADSQGNVTASWLAARLCFVTSTAGNTSWQKTRFVLSRDPETSMH